ncbi:MAG: DUF350 domain-containing protein [Myxococcota bacterium]
MPLSPIVAALDWNIMVESLVYAAAAMAFLAVFFLILFKAVPFSVVKEIEEDQNVALGIIMAAFILGVCYIIGRTFGG